MKLFMIAIIAMALQGCATDKGMRGDFEAFKASQNKNWSVMNKHVNANEKKHQEAQTETEALKTYMTENFEQMASDAAHFKEALSDLETGCCIFNDSAEITPDA